MKKVLIAIAAFILSLGSFTVPAMATNGLTSFGETQANILTGCAKENEDGHGGGIMCIINLVIDILSIGVGILGVIGISIAGIQYLTAGGNEEQTRKATSRLFEIVIGLAIYVVLYAIVKFLMPGVN